MYDWTVKHYVIGISIAIFLWVTGIVRVEKTDICDGVCAWIKGK